MADSPTATRAGSAVTTPGTPAGSSLPQTTKIPRIPVVATSREKISRGGRFPYKKIREFPWWLVPAGRVPVEASSRPQKNVNSRDG